jgi:hypothetical protein
VPSGRLAILALEAIAVRISGPDKLEGAGYFYVPYENTVSVPKDGGPEMRSRWPPVV